MYWVYILRNSTDKLYIGQTNNLESRIKRHSSGNGAKYTKYNFHDFTLVYSEEYTTRAEAMKRELQLKKWSRIKKEALISGDIKKLRES